MRLLLHARLSSWTFQEDTWRPEVRAEPVWDAGASKGVTRAQRSCWAWELVWDAVTITILDSGFLLLLFLFVWLFFLSQMNIMLGSGIADFL